jgi:hypothetical protein
VLSTVMVHGSAHSTSRPEHTQPLWLPWTTTMSKVGKVPCRKHIHAPAPSQCTLHNAWHEWCCCCRPQETGGAATGQGKGGWQHTMLHPHASFPSRQSTVQYLHVVPPTCERSCHKHMHTRREATHFHPM